MTNVETNVVPLEGHQILGKIRKALRLANDTHSWEDIRRGLLEGHYQIFQNDDGACITEIVQAPNKRYLNIIIVAGRLPGVMKLQKVIEQHAREQGCQFMVALGRRGWRKTVPFYGWTEDAVIFRKDVRHG